MISNKESRESAASPLIWSATPTPFTEDLKIDTESVHRLVHHHTAHGVTGIMLGGSCGEGPWVPCEDWAILLESAVECNEGRLKLAVQVTDNSAIRMLRHSEIMAKKGADAVVIAAPYFMMNATSDRIFSIYKETIENNPLPVIYYDRGEGDRYRVGPEQLSDLLSLDNLVMVKDSSCDKTRMKIGNQVKQYRPSLKFLTGNEFGVDEAIEGGMDGAFLGGAIFNAIFARSIISAGQSSDKNSATELQAQLNEYMYRIYGGKSISAWLTGLKYFLQRLGIFRTTASYLEYPLSSEVKSKIDSLFEEPERSKLVGPLLAPKKVQV